MILTAITLTQETHGENFDKPRIGRALFYNKKFMYYADKRNTVIVDNKQQKGRPLLLIFLNEKGSCRKPGLGPENNLTYDYY